MSRIEHTGSSRRKVILTVSGDGLGFSESTRRQLTDALRPLPFLLAIFAVAAAIGGIIVVADSDDGQSPGT